jgi:hypothetical protein
VVAEGTGDPDRIKYPGILYCAPGTTGGIVRTSLRQVITPAAVLLLSIASGLSAMSPSLVITAVDGRPGEGLNLLFWALITSAAAVSSAVAAALVFQKKKEISSWLRFLVLIVACLALLMAGLTFSLAIVSLVD